MLWEISIVKLPNYLNVTVHCISANCNIQKLAWKILLCEGAAAISDVILSLKTPHYSRIGSKNHFQDSLGTGGQVFFLEILVIFGTQRIQDFAAVGVGSRHPQDRFRQQCILRQKASVGVCCGPVCHDDAGKAPFLSCSDRAQITSCWRCGHRLPCCRMS